MRVLKIITLLFAVMLSVVCVQARQNKFGVADVRQVTLTAPTRIGDVLLPEGRYQVRHVMEGENHIMFFKQLDTPKPAEARVKCNLVSLQAKAQRSEITYSLNASNERVLRSLTFGGDSAQHVF